ncbi:MAG: DUF5615 family PIN-like protein [Actinobacteria bacterium]|nr:DUF5615 family PIN-like protein [Actinomycetota bacterium]
MPRGAPRSGSSPSPPREYRHRRHLSPRRVDALAANGHEAVHWSGVGALDAADSILLDWAREHGAILLSCDLDFGAILAATHATGPSVIQIRGGDVLPAAIGDRVARLVSELEQELERGVLVSLDVDQARVRVLPLRR